MAREILADTGFWVALFYPPDGHYSQARNTWRQVVRERWPTATTNWTIYETLTLFNCRFHRHDLAVRVLDFVSRWSQIIRIEEAQLEGRSLEIFRSHPDKRWSVVDCANFACIESRQCEFALAYDRSFEQAQLEFSFRLLKP